MSRKRSPSGQCRTEIRHCFLHGFRAFSCHKLLTKPQDKADSRLDIVNDKFSGLPPYRRVGSLLGQLSYAPAFG